MDPPTKNSDSAPQAPFHFLGPNDRRNPCVNAAPGRFAEARRLLLHMVPLCAQYLKNTALLDYSSSYLNGHHAKPVTAYSALSQLNNLLRDKPCGDSFISRSRNVSQTLSSASDISRIVSGSKGWPGVALQACVQATWLSPPNCLGG